MMVASVEMFGLSNDGPVGESGCGEVGLPVDGTVGWGRGDIKR
jgi:hypothetical protein